MRYLVAPDKFKGSLSAIEVAETIGSQIKQIDPSAELALLPLADGGEGTAELLAGHLGATKQTIETIDAIGRPIEAHFFASDTEAVLDMSTASGLWRIEPEKRAPLYSNTYGLGIILWHLIEQGTQRILIGLGGSATVDAGLGMAAALGYRFEQEDGAPIEPIPVNFSQIARVKPPLISRFPEVIGLADVETRLTGKEGAFYVYGKQKGLTEQEINTLDREVHELVRRLEPGLNSNFSDSPGAGAAGGLGYGVLAFLRGQLLSGFKVLAKRVALRDKIERVDIVITGEGKLDAQSLEGKAPFGVAQIARQLGKPVWAIAGAIEDRERLAPHFEKLIALVGEGVTVDDALRAPEKHLARRTRDLLGQG
jgi:glycerate 2-kinase